MEGLKRYSGDQVTAMDAECPDAYYLASAVDALLDEARWLVEHAHHLPGSGHTDWDVHADAFLARLRGERT